MSIGSALDWVFAHTGRKSVLLLLALVTHLPTWPLVEGGGPSALVLVDLNPKTLPITFEADGDPKDVKYASRSVYKPATVTTGGAKKDVRLLLQAKKDNAALNAVMQQTIRADDMDYRIRFAFDPGRTTGLVNGSSLGFFQLIMPATQPAEGKSSFRRLDAVYDADGGGFIVRATDGESLLGMSLPVANAEVVLRLRIAGGTLFMEAGAPTGPFVTDINTTELYSEPLGAEGTLSHTFGWGVSELGKGAMLYFNLLTLWGPLPDIGNAETPIAQGLMNAAMTVGDALYPSDVAQATQVMDDTGVLLASVVADLTTALDQGGLGATADGKRALQNAQKAMKLAQKAKAAGDKMLAAGKDNPKSFGKKARAIAFKTILALVQVGGYRSNSAGKVFKTVQPF